MYPQEWIKGISLLGGSVFGFAAGFQARRRLRLAIPSAILLVLFAYEFCMGRWEKTVHAPIRLDLFVEILVMTICLLFGIWEMVFRRTKSKEL